jgi:O-antigen/teichoic acid export membrane protein
MCSYRPRISFRAWRRLFGFSFWTWMQTMVFQIRDRCDSIVISRILGAAHFGTFSIATELGTLPVTEVVEPLGRSVFSGFVLLHRDARSSTRLYLDAVQGAVTVVLPAGLGISMVADPMVRFVLGERWLAAVPVIDIVAIASTVSIFGNLSAMFLTAGGKVRDTFILNTLSVSLRIPLMIGLIWKWGLLGGAFAVAISLLVDQSLYLWRTMRQLDITFAALFQRVWRALVAAIGMVACLAWLAMAWTEGSESAGWSTIHDLLVRCATGAVVYSAILLATWYLAGRPDGIEQQVLTLVGERSRQRRA